MNIGFDLDKVFIDYPPFVSPKLIDRLYKKRDNGILIYKIPSLPEQLIRNASHHPFLRKPIRKNLDFLKSISKKGNKLYLISSRFKFLEKRTQRLVKEHRLDEIFDKLFFNFKNLQPHIFKSDVIKDLKLDLYIDDDLSLLQHVSKENPNTHFFWLNQDGLDKSLGGNIFAISDLKNLLTHTGIKNKELGIRP